MLQKAIIELYTKYEILAPESSKTEILSFVGGKQIADVLSGNIDEFTSNVWNSLDADNKVSLYTRFIDIRSGEFEDRIVNKNC